MDFICYRSDGAAIRLHPSHAADAHPIIGHVDEWAYTADTEPSQQAFAPLDSPYTTVSGAAQPADKRKLYSR